MTAPADDLLRRRPVWEALSAVFLDTELDDAGRAAIGAVLRASGYSQPELERILWGELCPVLYVNMLSVAGEWHGFDMDYVEQRIHTRPAGWIRRWWSYINGGSIAQHEWRRIKAALAVQPLQ